MPEVSIIIVNWNTKALTEKAIASLLRHEKSVEFEIIMVDNASSDHSPEYLADKFPDIELIRNNGNLGFAKANNQGATRSKGKYLLLFNSDAFIETEILPACLAVMRLKGPCVLGCKLLNSDGSVQLTAHQFPSVWSSFLEIFSSGRGLESAKLRRQLSLTGKGEAKPVDWLKGAFLMTEKESYFRLGGLNEKIFMFGEDMEFCFRACRAGIPSYYMPGVYAVHLDGASAGRDSIRSMALSDAGRICSFTSMYGSFSGFLLRCFLITRSLLRCPLFLLLLPINRNAGKKFKAHFSEILMLTGLLNARHFI